MPAPTSQAAFRRAELIRPCPIPHKNPQPTLAVLSSCSPFGRPVDQRLQDVRCSEDKDTSRQDRNFLTRLRISAYALTLVAHREAPERGDLHRFATSQSLHDFGEDRLDEVAGFVARQSHFLEHGLAQIGARDSPAFQSGTLPSPELIHTLRRESGQYQRDRGWT